ncbi:MAG: ABC transporter permease [Chloroflexota bacterium]
MRRVLHALIGLKRHPSALVGTLIIAGLVCLGIYAVIAVPYSEAVRLWRGGEGIWDESPRNALPKWVNLFPGIDLPETLILHTGKDASQSTKTIDGVRTVSSILSFDYNHKDFPSELSLFLRARYEERKPIVSLFWLTPDGRKISLGEHILTGTEHYSLSLDQRLTESLGQVPEKGLFADPKATKLTVLNGKYELDIEATLFEETSDFDAEFIVYGKVAGLAGTDDRRRDLWLALMWGTPVALAFGLIAAAGSSITTLIIAAIGAWYGRWVDSLIQRLTELNAIIPTLPILILIGMFYSRSIWVMLAIIILLSIFSLGIKVLRTVFLQMKDSPYIEAARAYGAGNRRIILRYMVPRVIPLLVPQFVLMIPSLVFLEASLAILGLGDPLLPTWGKVLNDAFQSGALYKGYYHWVLMPSLFLMVTGLGFAMLGYTLDRMFNPRLRVE